MRPRGSSDLIADRRRKALKLLDTGLSLNAVARQVGCNASSVMRWRDIRRKKGAEVYRVRYSPGRPSRLTAAQLRTLAQCLLKGAMDNGFATDLWTTARIAQFIERRFGVDYHADHVGRLMARLGWSHQKPQRRAIERDEERIARWKRYRWPRIKKTPCGWVPISSSRTNRGSN